MLRLKTQGRMENSEKLHDKWFGSLFFCILNSLEFGRVNVYADSSCSCLGGVSGSMISIIII